jgi:hypothetical protein
VPGNILKIVGLQLPSTPDIDHAATKPGVRVREREIKPRSGLRLDGHLSKRAVASRLVLK